jgi:hypothetical protein
METNCDQEPHLNWWGLCGIEKPILEENEDVPQHSGVQDLEKLGKHLLINFQFVYYFLFQF